MAAPVTAEPAEPPVARRGRRWPFVVGGVVVVVALVAAGGYWSRGRTTRSDGELLPIPAAASGPLAAMSTRSFDGEIEDRAANWSVARTAGDDQQLVVSFSGGGCGTYHAEARESDEAVEVTIQMVWPGGGMSCNAMAMDQEVGIVLDAPLGDRDLGGAKVDDPVVIRGPELVSIDWPGGARRATDEHLDAAATGSTFTWTQRFDPGEQAFAEAIILTQERGPASVDRDAVAGGCQASDVRTTGIDLNGAEASLVECPNGTLAVWWMLDGDRISLLAAPDAPGMDPVTIVDLARTVRRGG